MLGHEKIGAGDIGVIVLNDWLCDTSTWDAARPYLDAATFTWVFADLRGYGRSKEIRGEYHLREAVADTLELADALQWRRFSIVGHSMSSLVAMHLAQHHAKRIERTIVLTPPPPAGFEADAATLAAMQAMPLGTPTQQFSALKSLWGNRLSDRWIEFKIARWRATAQPEAAAAYVAMFARDGLPTPAARIDGPVLAITGQKDADIMHRAAVTTLLSPLVDRLEIAAIADSGHYPMQEAPPLTVSLIEKFLQGETNET